MLEHVDEKYMANYMEAFKQARYAIVTHGELGQGGFNHVNNQHAQYWIEKFKEYGFKYEEALSAHARQLCDTSWGLTYQCSEWHPNHPKYNPKCANRRSGRPYSHFSTKGMIFKNTALEFRLDSVDSTISKTPHADFDETHTSAVSSASSDSGAILSPNVKAIPRETIEEELSSQGMAAGCVLGAKPTRVGLEKIIGKLEGRLQGGYGADAGNAHLGGFITNDSATFEYRMWNWAMATLARDPSKPNVLDVGCGMGFSTVSLHDVDDHIPYVYIYPVS